jgi:hypothetical protein
MGILVNDEIDRDLSLRQLTKAAASSLPRGHGQIV